MKYILDYNSINENKKETIRISCAGLATIKIDGKYLLIQNKKSRDSGVISYGPIGGALEFYPQAQDFLNEFVTKYERKTPDLRLLTTTDNIDRFTDWFNKRIDRETSCKREVIEELVTEEKVLNRLSESNIIEHYTKTIRDKSLKPELDGEVMTERYFDIFDITFDEWTTNKLREVSELEDSTIGLFTKDEIMKGGVITKHSQFIISD
jgi:HD superfamily phosphohydrolase